MTSFTRSVLAAGLLVLGFHAAPAQAQMSRTFVSAAAGNDANNCDRPTPCRTFQGAHNKTNADGEIMVLDTGGYGSVTITKSISIVNQVGEASILVSGSGVGVIINAGAASYVNLRGITIQGIGFGGGTGLLFLNGFSLTMTNCVIRNHTKDGIDFEPGSSSNLAVSNTLVADNGGSGIFVQPFGASIAKASFSRLEAYNNSVDGILATAPIQSNGGGWTYVNVVDSVVSNNTATGFHTISGSSVPGVTMSVIRSMANNNNVGAFATGGKSEIVFSQSTLLFNGGGSGPNWQGNIASYGDNNVDINDQAPIFLPPKK